MSVRSTTDMIRHLVCTAHRARHASTTSLPRPKRVKPEHGQQIFVYNHLQTNQVVYSLTKTLKNNDALRQLPFNGKKTVPRALRKDFWLPLATISFPPGYGYLGLGTFQKLRELRRLHETRWDRNEMTEDIEYEDGKVETKPLSRRRRGRKLMDQKANSVADIATVLGSIGDELGDSVGLAVEGKKGRWEEYVEIDGKAGEVTRKRWIPATEPVVVEVRWGNLLDAEFAETWKENVIHDVLERGSVESTYGEAVAVKDAARVARQEEDKRLEQLEK